MSGRVKSDEIATYLEESRGMERDIGTLLQKSNKRAWAVTWVSMGISVLSVAAVIGLTPLKSVEPFVLRVDNATGRVEQVSHLSDAKESYGEAVDRYFLNTYVLNREGYDYHTIQGTYDTTALLSSQPVQKEFGAVYDGPDGRDDKLLDRARIVVKVVSITPTPKGGSAVVRYTTQELYNNGVKMPVRNWIASIGYAYVNAPTAEADRRINPLGFQVTAYRSDPETVAGGGASAPAPSAPAPAPAPAPEAPQAAPAPSTAQ